MSRGPKRPSRFKERAFGVVAVGIGIGLVATLVLFVVVVVRCRQFKAEFLETAERHLGREATIDVAAVVSAREAARELVVQRGVRPEKLRVRLEQRDLPDGQVTHFVVLEADVGACHGSFERDLGQRLAPDKVAAFARAGVREYHRH